VHAVADPEHWHLVTYGLSELRSKESPDRLLSGWGFELTLRLAGGGEEPLWAVDLLANLAAYVWTSGHPFAAGHHLDLSGSIRLDTTSPITAAAIVTDPGLGMLDGPFGKVQFLEVVGLTAGELELCRSWSTEGVLDLLARDHPMLVTVLDRTDVSGDARWHDEIALRSARDGSALTELRVATLRWRRRAGRGVVVELGAGAAVALGAALRRELIGPGASFEVIGDTGAVRFATSAKASWAIHGGGVEVAVPAGELDGLAALFHGRTGWGRRPAYPGLHFRVRP